jgi:hypothetical protein
MRVIWVFVLVAGMAFNCRANLGDNEREAVARYGLPLRTNYINGFRELDFVHEHLSITVTFALGKSVEEWVSRDILAAVREAGPMPSEDDPDFFSKFAFWSVNFDAADKVYDFHRPFSLDEFTNIIWSVAASMDWIAVPLDIRELPGSIAIVNRQKTVRASVDRDRKLIILRDQYFDDHSSEILAKEKATKAEELKAQSAAREEVRVKAAGAALAFNEAAAARGDAYGLLRMGERYRDGEGVAKDLPKAREYLAQAAAAGNSQAGRELASLENR